MYVPSSLHDWIRTRTWIPAARWCAAKAGQTATTSGVSFVPSRQMALHRRSSFTPRLTSLNKTWILPPASHSSLALRVHASAASGRCKCERAPHVGLPVVTCAHVASSAEACATMASAPPHSQVLEEKLQRLLGTNEQLRADIEHKTQPISQASEQYVANLTQADSLLHPHSGAAAAAAAARCARAVARMLRNYVNYVSP